jgi:hypothetical protein
LYLFISSPLYAGFAAFDTVRQRRRMQDLVESLPDRRLPDRVPWLNTAVVAVGMHIVIVAGVALVAGLSDAVGQPYLSTTAIQIMSICAFVALGGLAGSLTSSLLVPPALTLVCIGLNVLVPTGPFRSVVAVGTGQVDLIGLRPDPRHEVVQAVVFGLVVAAALPLRRIAARIRPIASSTLAAGAAIIAFTGANAPSMLTPTSYLKTCADHNGVRFCGPTALKRYFATFAGEIARGADLLTRSGVAPPTGYQIVPPGHVPTPELRVMVADTETARDASQLALAARQALVGGLVCDIGRHEPPDESVIMGRATLDGWLQEELGQVEPGSYPSDFVARLRALPQPDRDMLIRQLDRQVNSCAPNIDAMASLMP